MAIALRYAARTDVGLVRSRNEDSGYAGPHLLVIADGMGGHAGGNVASSLTVGDLAHLDGDSFGSDEALRLLGESVLQANATLRQAMRENPSLGGMGTTLTALLRTGNNKLAMAHIGDSRAYLLRDGEMAQITRDHSFVQSLVDEGQITAQEAEHHPQRSLVTRVLTGQPSEEPDLSLREARVGDRYLICSDGLSDYVAADTIGDVLRQARGPEAAAERLVDLALRAGGPDNVTCIVADVVDAEEDTDVAPQVVGAAAERRTTPEDHHTAPLPQAFPVRESGRHTGGSAAEKAAALRRRATGAEAEPDGHVVVLAEEGPRTRRGRVVRRIGLLVLVVLLVAGGGYAAYDWTQRQFFVGEDRGLVTVFRGIPQKVGPVRASTPVEHATDLEVAHLPEVYRTKVRTGVSVASLADARSLVTDLRSKALTCIEATAKGESC